MKELNALARNFKNIHVLEIDLLDYSCYNNLLKKIAEVVLDDGLNVLVNNAGVAPKSTRIGMTNEIDVLNTLTTNVVVPIMLTKACLPLLEKASQRNESLPMGTGRATIVNMSSVLGSIEANIEGGMYAYRTSKAALNMVTKSLSIDLKNKKVLCISMHPGWVKTDMGGSKAPLDVATSCTEMVKTLMELTESHNGGFYQYDGKRIPW